MPLTLQHTEMPYRVDVPKLGTFDYSAASPRPLTHPGAVAYAETQGGVLVSLGHQAYIRNALQGQDNARRSHHSSTIVLYGIAGSSGVMRPFEPDKEVLKLLSAAGYAAHTGADDGTNQFHELKVRLNGKTEDPLELAVRKAWVEGKNRQANLSDAENWETIGLTKAPDYDKLRALLQEGLPYFIEDLQSMKRTSLDVGSLTNTDLQTEGITDESTVLVRSSCLGYGSVNYVVDAFVQFDYVRLARAVAVGAPQNPPRK